MHFFGSKGTNFFSIEKINEHLSFRSMDFVASFLYEFGQGDKSVEDAMNKAYGKTLKRFHDWNTRGSFSVNIFNLVYK